MRIQLEYKCYPVWIYDDNGLVEDTATEFYNKGFASPEEETTFKSNLKVAVAELAEKCPEGYVLETTPSSI